MTLFANMICWSFGVNNVASYAARHGNMPRPFALVSKKTGMPNGSALINGCFASLVLLLQIPLGEGSDVFWVFFSMNVVFLLMSYIPMFPAFWRLRKYDGRPRVFRAPFEGKVLAVALAVPVVELVLSIVATIVPLNSSPAEMSKLPILMGVVIGVLLGEVSRLISRRGRSIDNPGVGARGQVALHQNSSAASCAALVASWITAHAARDQMRAWVQSRGRGPGRAAVRTRLNGAGTSS